MKSTKTVAQMERQSASRRAMVRHDAETNVTPSISRMLSPDMMLTYAQVPTATGVSEQAPGAGQTECESKLFSRSAPIA